VFFFLINNKNALRQLLREESLLAEFTRNSDPFCKEIKRDVQWGNFVPLLLARALLDIRKALVWMYFSPIFSFEKEARGARKASLPCSLLYGSHGCRRVGNEERFQCTPVS